MFAAPHVRATDNNEPNDSISNPTKVGLNTTVQAELTTSDYDYYSIDVNFTGGLMVNVSLLNGLAHVDIEVSTAGSTYYYRYHEHQTVFHYYINYAIVKFILYVHDGDITPYTLSTFAFPDRVEPSNNYQSPTNISTEVFSPHIWHRNTGDQFYKFNLTSPGVTRISMLGTTATLQVSVYNDSGLLAYLYPFDVFGDGTSLILDLSAGEYYLNVSSIVTINVFYDLWITQTHVNYLIQNQMIQPFESHYGTVDTTMNSVYELSFDSPNGSTIVRFSPFGDAVISVYQHSDGKLLASGTGALIFDNTEKRYDLVIKNLDPMPVDYYLFIDQVVPDALEPEGNSMSTAIPFDVDYTALTIHNSTDVDWFSIYVGSAATATITTQFHVNSVPVLSVFDSSGAPITSNSTNETRMITIETHLNPGIYYIKITALKQVVIDYSLSLKFSFDIITSTKGNGRVGILDFPLLIITLCITTYAVRKQKSP